MEKNIEQFLIKKLPYVGVALVAFIVLMSSFTTVGTGELVRVQNNLSGGNTWYITEGFKFKVPFFSNVTRYSQEMTVAITNNDELCDTASICGRNRDVTFADTYGIDLETSFRYSLPRSPEALEKMHDKVKNAENLLGTVLLPFSNDLVNYTAAQFRAESFMQGGQNEFKSRLIDQAEKGMLVTKRVKESVKQEQADRDSDREGGKSKVGEQFVYRVKIVEDEEGNPLRRPTAISAYGVTIVPAGINLVEYLPEEPLRAFMSQKQERVRERARIVESQENEREKAITAQLAGDRERIEKQNALLVQKDAAIIKGQQEVEQAKLSAEKETVDRQKAADLAIIDKKRELQIAKDNEGIQKANAVAAKYEAQAIKEKGFAEAEVDRAKLKAKQDNKTIYLAELALEEAKAMASVLPNVKVTMPSIVMNGGSGSNSNQVSDLLSTKLVQDVIKSTNKTQTDK